MREIKSDGNIDVVALAVAPGVGASARPMDDHRLLKERPDHMAQWLGTPAASARWGLREPVLAGG